MLDVGCCFLVARAEVTPLLRGRFQGRRTSNRARVYRPAKRRNHRPPKSTRARRPNLLPNSRAGRIRPARHEQTLVPGGRSRMTAGGLSAQSLILPPGRALTMGTMKSTSFQRWMGMRCHLGPPFFWLTLACEQFMLIRAMRGSFGSRQGQVQFPSAVPLSSVAKARESCFPSVCRKLGMYYEVRRRLEALREYKSYLPGGSGACPVSLLRVSPTPAVGFGYATEATGGGPQTGHFATAQREAPSSKSPPYSQPLEVRGSRFRVRPNSIPNIICLPRLPRGGLGAPWIYPFCAFSRLTHLPPEVWN